MNKFKTFLNYTLIFLITFLLIQTIQEQFQKEPPSQENGIQIEVLKDRFALGKELKVEVSNYTEETLTIPSQCPEPPFQVFKDENGTLTPIHNALERDCSRSKDTTIAPGKTRRVLMPDYTYSLFSELGYYKLGLEVNGESYFSREFEIKHPSLLTQFWRNFMYAPILNALVAIIIYTPGHSLAWAVILLTILIRTILLIPSIKAIRAQKRMQEVQPKLEALRKQFEHDQARLAQETMALWKKHKVHPLSSCMPLLIQFPILIALYMVVVGGLSPDKSAFIYPFLPEFSLSEINPNFLGFNLLDRSLFVFPIAIGILQFIQMQLMSVRNDKDKKSKPVLSEMEQANRMMKYVLPVMIAVFASQLPSAVALYWGTSTFYGILQQLVVNREGPADSSTDPEDEVKVRVINKNHGKKD